MQLSLKQKDTLWSLFVHIWNVKHCDADPHFGYYAEQLDKLHVPWTLQNQVAALAEIRANGFSSFDSLLETITPQSGALLEGSIQPRL